MSLKTNYSKNLGPSRRNFDADTSLAPFEVIDVGDNKVAINEGILIHGSSAIAYSDLDFTGSCKPQNLLGGDVDSGKFLTVKKGDFVVVLLTNVDSSKPKAEIKAVAPADLDKEAYKRKANKVIKIAQILNQKTVEEKTFLKIKNLHASQIIADTENWPAFTPIIWPVEKLVDEDPSGETAPPTTWKAVFIPGSVYLPQTMDECKVFSINGTTMLDLPIIEVKKGDKWYVTYEIDKKWKIKNTPTFTKAPGDREIEKVVPEGPECDISTSTSDSPCSPKEGYFKLKVLEFVEKEGGGLHAKMYWKSDICIYGWERCPSECDGSEDSDDSDSSGVDSSSEPPVDPPSSESDSSDSDSSDDPDPEVACQMQFDVTGTCYGVVTSTQSAPSGGNPSSLGSGCMTPGDTRPCFLGSDFSEGGSGGYVKIIGSATITPEDWSDCAACGPGGLAPLATLWVEVGGIKGYNVVDLNVGGSAYVCAIIPGSPCGNATVTGYLTMSDVVEERNPDCSPANISVGEDENMTVEVPLPAMGIIVGSDLVCGDCETTPNPEGP